MLRTAWLLTGGDWALAEDLAQAAFSQAWRHWTRVSVMEAPEAYTHKIMLNTFLSWRRRRWTAEISTERFVVSPATTGGFTTVDRREVLLSESLTPWATKITSLTSRPGAIPASTRSARPCPIPTSPRTTA